MSWEYTLTKRQSQASYFVAVSCHFTTLSATIKPEQGVCAVSHSEWLGQRVFRLFSPSFLSIDCMRKDCERTKLFLASFGRKSNIFHFCFLWVCIPFKLLLYLWLNRFFQEHPLPWFMARHMKDEVTFIFVLILLSVYVDKKQIHNAY